MKILRESARPIRDYTKKRLGTKTERGRLIGRCPECGEKGEVTTYRGGDQNVVHRFTFDGIGWSTVSGTDAHYVAGERR